VKVDELIDRIHSRGGEIRLVGSVVQYRPATSVTEHELSWLRRHEDEVAAALAAPDVSDRDAFMRWLACRFGDAYVPVGDAGPDTPAWARTSRV
jgi:hypothetical protein